MARTTLSGPLAVTAGVELPTSGSAALAGTSGALSSGTVTVTTSAVQANSIILLSHAAIAGTAGILDVNTITAGTSFVIESDNVLDTSTVNWLIINPTS